MTVPVSDLVRVFGRIGVLSFGGPAAQIALMHRVLVEEREWLDEATFLRALSFTMLLPGPEAMQLATYAGWRLRGVPGGLIAGLLFVLPGAAVVFALAALYASFGDLPLVASLFFGVKAAVIAVVAMALLGVARRALKGPGDRAIALASFAAIFVFSVPFPAIVAAAALWGGLRAAPAPGHAPATPPPPPARTARTVALWLALWLAPVAALAASGATFLTGIALFFSKLAVVTFGGAYAVLAYMTQEVVFDRGWLTMPQMVDALGLAETTPGPLILVTQFVAYLAGHGADGPALAAAAALIALWVTFAPCFLWIFAGAPWLDRITARPRLAGALSAITAAVVGVILNLAIWFAAHVLFDEVARVTSGPVNTLVPVPASFDPAAAGLALLALFALAVLRWPLVSVLALSALVGAGLGAIAGAP